LDDIVVSAANGEVRKEIQANQRGWVRLERNAAFAKRSPRNSQRQQSACELVRACVFVCVLECA